MSASWDNVIMTTCIFVTFMTVMTLLRAEWVIIIPCQRQVTCSLMVT